MAVSRKRVAWSFVSAVVLVAIVVTIVGVVEKKMYAVREGTVSGVLRISSLGEWSYSGTSHPIYLSGDDGMEYRLWQATNEAALRGITLADEGDRLEVTGRYWRPCTHGSIIFSSGRTCDGPEMTDDPIDSFETADFIFVVDAVTVNEKA